eukprot:1159664-Pelagomonas_calceolata.AAC.3
MEHHPYADAPVGHEHGDPDVPYQGMDVATIHAAAQQLERLQNGQSNGLQNGQVRSFVATLLQLVVKLWLIMLCQCLGVRLSTVPACTYIHTQSPLEHYREKLILHVR